MVIRFSFYQPDDPHRNEVMEDRAHRARVGYNRWQARKQSTKVQQQGKDKTQTTNVSRRKNPPTVQSDLALTKSIEANYDPFNTHALPITPRVLQILVFIRDVAIPAVFFDGAILPQFTSSGNFLTRYRSPPRANMLMPYSYARREWETVVESLNNELTSLSRFLAYAALWARAAPELDWVNEHMTRWQGKALQALRHALLTNYSQLDKTQLALQLAGLFRTACMGTDFLAVKAHGTVLRKLFEEGHYTLDLLTEVLYYDGDFAAKHGRRCVLDVDPGGWCEKTLDPLWEELDPFWPTERTAEHDVHENVTIPRIRACIARMKDMCNVMVHLRTSTGNWAEDSEGDRAFFAIANRGLLILAQLNSLYLDLNSGQASTDQSEGYRQTQAAICAALQFLKRLSAHRLVINGINHRDASQILFRELHLSIRAALEQCTAEEGESFSEAHLWCLYVGAWHKARECASATAFNSLRTSWFGQSLRRQAIHMSVTTWEEMRAIAERFLYMGDDPKGTSWFENLVQG